MTGGSRVWLPRRADLLRRPGLLVAAVVSLLFLLLLVDVGWRALDVARASAAARDELVRARGELQPLVNLDLSSWTGVESYRSATERVGAAREDLEHARGRLAYLAPLSGLMGWVPRWGDDLANGPEALEVAHDATIAIDGLLGSLSPLLDGEGSTVERTRQVFVLEHEVLDARLAALELMRERALALESVEWDGPFASAGPLLAEAVADLERVPELRELTALLAGSLDAALGFEGARTYLVLGQNEQEIRATGGFIGTMGLVTVEDGEIVASDYRSSYEFDPPTPPVHRLPPVSMQQSLGIGVWHLRDANWSPWFDESANTLLGFFEEDQGVRPDGVVAVDSPFMRIILDATGPLSVPALDEPLAATTFTEQVESALFGDEPGRPGADGEEGNLVPNGGFESGVVGWEILGLGEPQPSALQAADGATALHIDIPSRPASATFMFTAPIPITAGQTYTASWHLFQVEASEGFSRGGILWYDNDLQYMGPDSDVLTAFDGGSYEGFRRFQVSGTAPDGARYARVSLNMDGFESGARWEAYLDAVQLEVGPAAGPYLETDRATNEAIEKRRLLQPVLQGLLERMQAVSGDQIAPLIGGLQRAVGGRHLQAYARDEQVNQLFQRLGMGGLPDPQENRDFVAVIDSNVSYVKIQSVIEREVIYLRRVDGVVDLLIRWTNRLSTFDGSRYERLGATGMLWDHEAFKFRYARGTYGNFVRVYLPGDVEVVGITGVDGERGVSFDRDMTVVSGLVVVEDGATQTMVVSYRPSEGALEGVDFWKQGGLEGEALTVIENREDGQQVQLFKGQQDADVSVDFDATLAIP